MDKSKKSIIFITAIILIFCIFLVYINKSNLVDDSESLTSYEISDELLQEINELNQIVDEYYLNEWINEQFLSVATYFAKEDSSLVTIEDIEEFADIEISNDLSDVSFHFVNPETLVEFLPNGILDEELDIMTVFTAVPVEGGVYISSLYDEGGFLSNEKYKEFLLKNYFEHGEIINPSKEDTEYQNILEVVSNNYEDILNGNVKYIAYDDKYAVLIISTNTNPSYTKEFILIKEDSGNWEVGLDSLESSKFSKLVVNYKYNDFNLNLLPIYEVSSFATIENLEPYLNIALEEGFFKDEEIIYSSGAGNFVYFESKEGTKLIIHIDELNSSIVLYEVNDYKEGIVLMDTLEENPPVFILKFEN